MQKNIDRFLSSTNTKLISALGLRIDVAKDLTVMNPRDHSRAIWVGVDFQLSKTINQEQSIEAVVTDFFSQNGQSNTGRCWLAIKQSETADGAVFYEVLDKKRAPYSEACGFIYALESTVSELNESGVLNDANDMYSIMECEIDDYNKWILSESLTVSTKPKGFSGKANVMSVGDLDKGFDIALAELKNNVNMDSNALVMTLEFTDDRHTPDDAAEAIEQLSRSLLASYSTRLGFGDFNYDKQTKLLKLSFVVLDMPSLKSIINDRGEPFIKRLRTNCTALQNSGDYKAINEWALVLMVMSATNFKKLAEQVKLALMISMLESLGYAEVVKLEVKN